MRKGNSIVLVVVLVAAVLAVFFAGQFSAKQQVGSDISYYEALNRIPLHNALVSLAGDDVILRTPLAGIGTGTSAAIDFGNLANNTVTSTSQTTTTQVTNLAGQLGDKVLIAANTPTTGAQFFAYVSTASTTSATFTINEMAIGSAAVNATSTTFSLVVLPAASFAAPAALNTTTSTTP